MLNTGTTLLGSTAIVASLILFAMQINIKRMPYRLFRRLSADYQLLITFAIILVLAVGIATLSALSEQTRHACYILSAAWAVFCIPFLYCFAYRRALGLINPYKQLDILRHDTCKDFQKWSRRVQSSKLLIEPEETKPTNSPPNVFYFECNSDWTANAKERVSWAVSLARYYSEQGDYEVSKKALDTIVEINREYVKAKGKTFHTNHPLAKEDPQSRDPFINDTLEHLRQNIQIGATRQDEQQLQQTMQALRNLVSVYQDIEYFAPNATSTHAQLAAYYLSSMLQTVIPNDMTDVLMSGVRLMRESAQCFISRGKLDEIEELTQGIASVALRGCLKADYNPVTEESMAQLAELTFRIISAKSSNPLLALHILHQNVAEVSNQVLKMPNPPFGDIHQKCLGPYYSSNNRESLLPRIGTLVDTILKKQVGREAAPPITQNICFWIDGHRQVAKELLSAAIDARSFFVGTMIHWIQGVTKLLLDLSSKLLTCSTKESSLKY